MIKRCISTQCLSECTHRTHLYKQKEYFLVNETFKIIQEFKIQLKEEHEGNKTTLLLNQVKFHGFPICALSIYLSLVFNFIIIILRCINSCDYWCLEPFQFMDTTGYSAYIFFNNIKHYREVNHKRLLRIKGLSAWFLRTVKCSSVLFQDNTAQRLSWLKGCWRRIECGVLQMYMLKEYWSAYFFKCNHEETISERKL